MRRLLVPALLLSTLLALPASAARWGYDPATLPEVLTEKDFDAFGLGSPARIWGFIDKDFSGKDLRALSPGFLARQSFDTATRWPTSERLPAGFSPRDWLELGKDPGLGLRDLHRRGITGEGVTVAVIDKPIRATHRELDGRITYLQVYGDELEGLDPHFHGLACASILAGETVGVAPGAHVIYLAVPDVGRNFEYYARAARHLITLNEKLPDADKVRLVSISDGLGRDNPHSEDWKAARSELEEAGIEVVFSDVSSLNGLTWGGAVPWADRSDPSRYAIAHFLRDRGVESTEVILPGDYRTTASNASDDAYVWWGDGGYSWAIPYAAGLAALAWQVRPDRTIHEIEAALLSTATDAAAGAKVVQPAAFIERIQGK